MTLNTCDHHWFQPDIQLQYRRISRDSSLGNKNIKNGERRKMSAESVGAKSRKKSSVVAIPIVEPPSPVEQGGNSPASQKKVNSTKYDYHYCLFCNLGGR